MKTFAHIPRRRAQGFTLVETIVVMVITAILAGTMVLFIRRPALSYVETAGRADMADVADLTLRRMTRELHGALPNSIRFMVANNVSYLEFIPSKAGGVYLAAEDGADTTNTALAVSPATAASQFTVVGPMPAAPYAIAANDYIVVYNLGTGFSGADAYAGTGTGTNMALVSSVAGQVVAFNGAKQFPYASPSKRFQVVGRPVTFACSSDTTDGRGKLTRISNYGFNAIQQVPTSSGGNTPVAALMADNVYGCQFWVQQTANQNTALVGVSIALARASASSGGLETATLSQQIHVDNTP